MVGYDPKTSNLKQSDVAFAGAASGFITRGICQPLDVLKIRFQLQVEPISSSTISKYRSIPQALYSICHEEGIRSMWKGHVPAQWLSITYGLGQFWCFEVTTKRLHLSGYDEYKPFSNFLCGAVAGTFATIVSFPFDVVRTRLVAQNEMFKVYNGMLHTIIKVYRNNGFFMLYRGILPTVLQVAPNSGVQFATYKIFESLYYKLFSDNGNVFIRSAICGSLAGLFAKISIYPLDLTKKRMQVQGLDRKVFGKNFVCHGLADCIRKTYQYEGLFGLYKGLGPSLIKAVMSTALHFASYELICQEIAKHR